ncbi:primosomal protein [Microbacterium mangrovi]|uniref:primosomal protein n=1 Tax=Microbacterium mangrovi TaxID=1348253 RepID=UPI000AD1143C|nr:primosomal protein [Microbacterium mangrovi]
MSDADERKGAGKHDGKRDAHGSGRPTHGSSRGGQRRYSEHRDGAPRRDGERRYGNRDGAPRQGGAPRHDGERRYGNRDGAPRQGGAPRHDGERRYGNRDGAPRQGGAPRHDGERRYGNRDGAPRRDGDRHGNTGSYRGEHGRPDSPHSRDGERRPWSGDKRHDERKPYRGGKPADRSDDRRHDDRRHGGGSKGDGKYGASRDGRHGGPRRNDRDDSRRSSRPPQDERAKRAPEPELPEDITARDLHPSARNELKTLSKENADAVARHLAMAGILIDEDPQLAHEHALAASRRAGRVAVVRETVAITAYAIGDYPLALRELRTYRRISGRDDQIALIVDSERGVGRPERALEEGRAVDRSTLPIPVRVQLAIAMSGARLDLGQADRALIELDIPELDPDRAFEWSPALFLARATVLDELGRTDEAEQWNRRAAIAAEALDAAAGVGEDETIEVEEIFEEHDDEEAPAEDATAEEIVVVDELIEDERD